MGHGIDEPSEQRPIVGHDIAVMQRDRFRLVPGNGVAQAKPNIPPLPCLDGRKPMILQLGIDRAKTGAIVPKDALMLRQSVKKFKGVAVFIFRSPIKANGDFTEIGYFF